MTSLGRVLYLGVCENRYGWLVAWGFFVGEWPYVFLLCGFSLSLFCKCFVSDHASAVLLAAFPSDHTPGVAATDCLVPFFLDPAAALGRLPLGA